MSRSHSHVISLRAIFARLSREYVQGFSSSAIFHAFLPLCSFYFSRNGSLATCNLPDPAADTHAHFRALPRCPHTLEEATYTGGLLVGGGSEWAKGLDPSPTLIHIDTREPARDGALRKKGWTTELWHQLQLALLELRAVRLIPAPKTVDSLLGVMSQQGAGKLKSGVCTVYPTTNLLHCPPPPRMDMIAFNEYFCAADSQGEHSSFPFRW